MPAEPSPAVFLSYASQDAEAARRICEALRAAGVEVWFDQNELVGGDAWDAKIRKQIKECALFMPVISANTNARREGYFRREWKLAVDRTHDMDEALPFLLPVVIDGTSDAGAFVPEKFREVQWTRLAGGKTSEAFSAQVRRLLAGDGSRKETRRPRPVIHSGGAAAQNRRSRWPWLALAAAVVLAFVGWRMLRPDSERGVAHAVPGLPSVQKAATEFPRDPELARAWKLIMDDNYTSEDAAFAEEIVKPMRAQRPTDPEVAIVSAWVGMALYLRGDEQGEERRNTARRYADRAVQLAPENPWALAAQAHLLRGERERAEKLARQAIAINPNEPWFYYVLAASLPSTERIKIMEEAVARFPNSAFLHFRLSTFYQSDSQTGLAEQARDRSIELAPIAHAMTDKAAGALRRGDLGAIKALLDRMPEKSQGSDRVVFWRYLYACVSGDSDHGFHVAPANRT